MGVALTHDKRVLLAVPLALRETGRHPRRHAQTAQHDHHRRGVVVAVALAQVEQHPVDRVAVGRRLRNRLLIDDVRAQPLLDRVGLLVGCHRPGVGHDLLRQLNRALRHRRRHLEVEVFDPVRVLGRSAVELGRLGAAHQAGDGVGVAPAQHVQRPDDRDIHVDFVAFRPVVLQVGSGRQVHPQRLRRGVDDARGAQPHRELLLHRHARAVDVTFEHDVQRQLRVGQADVGGRGPAAHVVQVEDARAPVVAPSQRRFGLEHHLVAQPDRAAQLQRLAAIVVGRRRAGRIGRGEQAVPQLAQLLQRLGLHELLKVVEPVLQVAGRNAPADEQRQQRQHRAHAEELLPEPARHTNAVDVPVPFARVQVGADDEQQRQEHEDDHVTRQVDVAGVVDGVADEDQPRRQDGAPDAVDAEDVPGDVVAEEPEQAGYQQREHQIVLVDAAAGRVRHPAEQPREDAERTFADAARLVDGGDEQHEARAVDAAHQQRQQFVVVAARQQEAEQHAEDDDRHHRVHGDGPAGGIERQRRHEQ